MALIGPVDAGGRDELAQRVSGLGGVAGVSDDVELADDLEPILARAWPALGRAVRGRRVEAPPQQVEDLRSRQQMRREIERLEIAADRIRQVQRLARDSPMRRERAFQRRASEPPASAGQQRPPVEPLALVRQVGHDDVVGDVDGGLLVGMTFQRFAQRRVQPSQRGASLIVARRERPDRALGLVRAVREERVEPDRCRLDVELDRLPGLQPAGELPECVTDLRALGR